jgi:hypothetical protein
MASVSVELPLTAESKGDNPSFALDPLLWLPSPSTWLAMDSFSPAASVIVAVELDVPPDKTELSNEFKKALGVGYDEMVLDMAVPRRRLNDEE